MERITQHEPFALSFSWDLQMLDEYDGINVDATIDSTSTIATTYLIYVASFFVLPFHIYFIFFRRLDFVRTTAIVVQ